MVSVSHITLLDLLHTYTSGSSIEPTFVEGSCAWFARHTTAKFWKPRSHVIYSCLYKDRIDEVCNLHTYIYFFRHTHVKECRLFENAGVRVAQKSQMWWKIITQYLVMAHSRTIISGLKVWSDCCKKSDTYWLYPQLFSFPGDRMKLFVFCLVSWHFLDISFFLGLRCYKLGWIRI